MKTIIVLSKYFENTEANYEDYTHNHAKEYIKKGYKVYAFAPFPVLPFQNFIKKNSTKKKDGVNVIIKKRLSISNILSKTPLFNFNNWLYYISIKKDINQIIKNEDVVFIDANSSNAKAYVAYKLKKKYPQIKSSITFHGSELEYFLSFKSGVKTLKKYSKYVEYFVCVSEKLAKKLNNIGIKNTKVIYNGIYMPKLKEAKKEKTFISVGSLIESKNFNLLIDAFAKFSKTNSEYNLKIIGDGPLKQELIDKVERYNIQNRVEFLGFLSNQEVYEELIKAYAFLLPSKPEGFGIVYGEAMYCGCVTIGTKQEGIDGFIKNNINGFLIDANVTNIVEIMEYITKNNCESITKQSIEDSKSLTWEKNINKYIELFREKL